MSHHEAATNLDHSFAVLANPPAPGMHEIRNRIELAAPRTEVFRLLTSAGLWPQWHTATRAITGVVDRPYQVGDEFEERADVGEQLVEIHWRCLAHDAPRGAVIETREGSVRISYALDEHDGRTVLNRWLHLTDEALRVVAPGEATGRRLLHRISQDSLERFKALVHGRRRAEDQPALQ